MEKPNSKGSETFVVGLFVLVAVIVSSGFVVFMGGTSFFGSEMNVRTIFRDVRGLNVGAPVFLSGIQVGRVSNFSFPESSGSVEVEEQGVVTTLTIEKRFATRVRASSQASITTMGVVGDKVVVVSPGEPDSPAIDPEKDYLVAENAKELSDYFARGGNLVEELNKLTANLNRLVDEVQGSGRLERILANVEKSSANLSSMTGSLQQLSKEDLGPAIRDLRMVLNKVNRGQGTLGALVNDSSLHEDLRILLGGAKRSQLVRFLVREAIKGNEPKVPETPRK